MVIKKTDFDNTFVKLAFFFPPLPNPLPEGRGGKGERKKKYKPLSCPLPLVGEGWGEGTLRGERRKDLTNQLVGAALCGAFIPTPSGKPCVQCFACFVEA